MTSAANMVLCASHNVHRDEPSSMATFSSASSAAMSRVQSGKTGRIAVATHRRVCLHGARSSLLRIVLLSCITGGWAHGVHLAIGLRGPPHSVDGGPVCRPAAARQQRLRRGQGAAGGVNQGRAAPHGQQAAVAVGRLRLLHAHVRGWLGLGSKGRVCHGCMGVLLCCETTGHRSQMGYGVYESCPARDLHRKHMLSDAPSGFSLCCWARVRAQQ